MAAPVLSDAEQGPLPAPSPEKTAHAGAGIRSWLEQAQSLASTIVIAIFVILFAVQAFQIPSGSMENTLLVGDYLLVDKFAYAPSGRWDWLLPYEKLRRGDIIVFKWPVHPEEHFVKRVIGLPGDRIHLVNGSVFVNGDALREDYAVHKLYNHDNFRDEFPSRRVGSPGITQSWWADIPAFTRNNDLIVPQDSYFVLGDNRDDSLDSRYWGFVPRENIVGKPLVIYFSMRHFEDDPLLARADDKIGRFADRARQLPSLARWGRMLHFVK